MTERTASTLLSQLSTAMVSLQTKLMERENQLKELQARCEKEEVEFAKQLEGVQVEMERRRREGEAEMQDRNERIVRLEEAVRKLRKVGLEHEDVLQKAVKEVERTEKMWKEEREKRSRFVLKRLTCVTRLGEERMCGTPPFIEPHPLIAAQDTI